jgi:hypothetical protein
MSKTKLAFYLLFLMPTIEVAASPLGCTDLGIGESRRFDLSDKQSPSGVEMRYVLKRKEMQNYQAFLNLEFFAKTGSKKDSSKGIEMLKKVQSCVRDLNPSLRGPEGKTLEIIINDAYSEAPLQKIALMNPGYRSHSRAYAEDITCSTIMHELMHLMGLVDEYVESESSYDCRAIGPDDSLMSSQTSAVFNLLHQSVLDFTYMCLNEDREDRITERHRQWITKNESDIVLELKKLRNSNNNDFNRNILCPKGMKASFPLVAPKRFSAIDSIEQIQNSFNVTMQRNMFREQELKVVASIAEDSLRTSILYTRHFEMIVNPGCSVNHEYYQCAAHAYTATKKLKPGCAENLLPLSCARTKNLDSQGRATWNTEWLGRPL